VRILKIEEAASMLRPALRMGDGDDVVDLDSIEDMLLLFLLLLPLLEEDDLLSPAGRRRKLADDALRE